MRIRLVMLSTALVVAGCSAGSESVDPSVLSACRVSAVSMNVAIEAAYAKNTRYPTTMGQLVRDGFITPGSGIEESTGTSVTQTSGTGEFQLDMTFDADGVPEVKGTVDGDPC